MSDPIKSFFRKYHAVPADDTGPQWSLASDEALVARFNVLDTIAQGWHRELNRDATPTERQAVLPERNEMAAEITRRANLPDPSPDIFAAYCVRILHRPR